MRKFLYSVFMLAAVVLVFTACSNDETIETSGNGQNNKGMVLVATVSQQDSRATIDVDVNDTKGTWKFTFDDNDNVVVGNNTIDNYYTFTKNGDNFSCADAKPTASPTTWYAYYPGTDSTSPIRKAQMLLLLSSTLWQVLQPQLQRVKLVSLSI